MIVLLCDLVFAAKASKLECFGAAGDPWYESVSSGHLVGPDGVPVWFSGLPVSYGNRFWEIDYGDPLWGFVSLVLWVSGLDTDLVDLLRSGRLVRTQCSDASVTGGCFELVHTSIDLVTALGGIHDTGSVWPPIGGVLIRIGRPAGRMDQVGAVSDSYVSWFSTPRGSCGCDPVVSLVRRANTKETLSEWTEELCICGGSEALPLRKKMLLLEGPKKEGLRMKQEGSATDDFKRWKSTLEDEEKEGIRAIGEGGFGEEGSREEEEQKKNSREEK
uniref:Uncharacterized protein n=1 Tax=Ananas comosus var. bracteatus TaxID=296719 RepID=A0A6V7QCP1_ANACO|nr:unnamed protein product [Ananas comosus var. bracteatus]